VVDALTAILDEILDVKSSLRELPPDAFSERVELRDRLIELQAAAADAGRNPTTEAALRRHLAQLEQRRDALLDQRIEPSWQDGSLGGTGISAEQTSEFNRRIDEAADLPAIDDEIARIRGLLIAHDQG